MARKGELSIILSRFLQAIKNRDYSAITWTFMSPGFRVLGLLSSVLVVLILWILKPVFWLKVGRLSSARIGHLTLNTDLFLRRRQLGIYPDGPFYCFLSDPRELANRQLLTMFKRVIPVCESRILILMFVGIRPILKRTPFYQDLSYNADEDYEFKNANSTLSFTPDEIEKGRKFLNRMNVDLDKDEFVCIFARDDAYLNHAIPYNNWNYHNIRNSDIDNLIKTAKYLIEKGYIVIRMGSIVKNPINFSHEKMIDYPYSGDRSDFLDIFLHAHCKFLISAGASGINSVADIFDRPILFVDVMEFGKIMPLSKHGLFTPKKYKYSNTNNYLHFEDAKKFGDYWHHMTRLGLEYENNRPEDILEATQEMLMRLEGRFKYSPEDERLIQAFNKLWAESGTFGSCIKTPIGMAWLKKNQALYF
jgi:putative glycosyltransferase (TIGR04372 family)